MKKIVPLLFPVLFVSNSLIAQHCPFDGGAMVVIKLTAADGKPVTCLNQSLSLTEIDHPLADSCTYAEGLLELRFDIPQINLVKKYEGSWEARASVYLENCSFNQPGYYVVVLNQAQHRCMVNRNNNFTYLDRHFEIRQKTDSGPKLLATVPPDMIYPLCTANGEWARIKAIELNIEE